jgi:hypothetical protein
MPTKTVIPLRLLNQTLSLWVNNGYNSLTMNNPKENQGSSLLNILFNVILPSVILIKFSGSLGSVASLIVALFFPIVYGAQEFIRHKKSNILSIIGFVSILLTGLIGLLQLKPEYLAIKEALIPLIIAVVVFSTQNSKFPLVIKLFEQLLDLDHIKSHLDTPQKKTHYEKVLRMSSTLVGLSFLVSSVLNYVLARIVVVSAPGSVAFNEELGKMTALSYPVIALPSSLILVLAIWVLIKKLQTLTGLTLEELLKIKND